MRRFSDLYEALDSTSSTGAKVEAMAQYFRAVPAEDAAWAVFFLTGQRLKRLISGRTLRDWALRYTGLPEWLVGDAHAATGDSAETVTLLVHEGAAAESEPLSLHRWLEERILPLRELADEQQYAKVTAWWRQLPRARAVRAQQAADRGISGRRLAASGGAGAGRGFRTAARHHRPSPDGQLAADRHLVPGVARGRPRRRRPLAALSVLPGLAARSSRRIGWAASIAGSPNGSGMASAPS